MSATDSAAADSASVKLLTLCGRHGCVAAGVVHGLAVCRVNGAAAGVKGCLAAIAASIASGVATGVATATGGCSWGRWRPLRRSDACNLTDPWWASVYSSIGPRMGSCGCRGIYADNLILIILLITRPSRASSRVPRRTSSVLTCRRKASCFSSLFSTHYIMVLTSPSSEGI